MYSGRTRTFKTSSSDTPATNQFAPRKFKVQPLPELVSPQQSTPDLQQQPEATPASESHFYKVSMSPRDLVQKKPNSHGMNLKIDPNVRANVFGETVQPDVQKKAEVANFTVSSPAYQPPRLQMKLSIGQPGDKYEQEADRVAADVVQQINAPQHSSVQREKMQDEEELQMKPMVQRVSDGGMAATPDLEASIQRAKGSGQPLSDNIRQPMEQAFGADFSGVKVHADAQSDELNQSIQAKAFTTGQDIFFRQGAYNPGSRGGQELIAHELTHVVQQNGATVQQKSLGKGSEGHLMHFVSQTDTSKAVVQRGSLTQEEKDAIKKNISQTRNFWQNLNDTAGEETDIEEKTDTDEESDTEEKTDIEEKSNTEEETDIEEKTDTDEESDIEEKTDTEEDSDTWVKGVGMTKEADKPRDWSDFGSQLLRQLNHEPANVTIATLQSITVQMLNQNLVKALEKYINVLDRDMNSNSNDINQLQRRIDEGRKKVIKGYVKQIKNPKKLKKNLRQPIKSQKTAVKALLQKRNRNYMNKLQQENTQLILKKQVVTKLLLDYQRWREQNKFFSSHRR
ncbi:MAG: DUF4157 domain-containing protein [Trichormus sp. ATA11-4-KO1]|jgi:hypothetical protein|nr:DUF4157 domain-containing protein [Trichormus sp. ATA11-4-KO1]